MTRNQAIFAFSVGYTLMLAFLTGVAYLILRPFGVGYIGAELMMAYLCFCTVSQWETVNNSLSEMLSQSGL